LVACSEQGIRSAIAQGGGPHFFDCKGPTTVVTQAEIGIDNDVILDGEGNLTVDGNGDHRVFSVVSGVTAELREVTVMRGAADSGGGIYSGGSLTLTNSTVSGNSAEQGGGIYHEGDGDLTITDSRVSGNTARAGGGGIYELHGMLTLTNSAVSDNTAGFAGGLRTGGGTLMNSTVSGNSVPDVGAGILFSRGSGTLTLTNSTVSGNSAGGSGGGIFCQEEELTLANTTLSGNTAHSGDAIFTRPECTLAQSIATLIEGDCAASPPGGLIWVSGDHNIESPGNTCGFDQPTDQVNVTSEDLNLGPLQDNGGLTETHAPLPGSVAIDRIPEGACVDAAGSPLTTDQRGEPRPETGGSRCDIGAFEVQP
jgi:predicted outer membrane repeat protein